MFRKTAIALAVGAFMSSPAVNAADFQINDSTKLSVYGTIEPSLTNETDAAGESSTEFTDNDSTFGLKAKHKFSDAVTGFAKAEFEFNADEENDEGLGELDEAYFGLEGGFGKIRFGSNDTIYEDQVAEILDEFENAAPSEERNNGEGNQITYFSPSFGGASFAAELRFLGENEDENPTGDSETGIELVGRYDGENWGVAAGFADGGTATTSTGFVDESTIGVGGYVGFGNIELRARYATEDQAGGGSTDYLGGLVGFNYGSGDVFFAVQDVSPDGADSRTEISVGVYHNLYKNLQVYLEAGTFDEPNDEGDIVETGLIFKF